MGDDFEAAKAASVGQLLFKAARLWNEQAIERVRAQGFPIRTSHTLLFPHLDLHGTRLTVLAKRVGISKQAVGQLVDDLQAMGVVERVADPHDARAKLIVFSADRGQPGLFAGLRVLGEMQQELAAEIGSDDMARLHGILTRLVACLDARSGDLGSGFDGK